MQVWQVSGWSNVASLARVAEGWQATSLTVPTHATLRLQGWIPGGFGCVSAGLAEAFAGAPLITRQPVGKTNRLGAASVFSIQAVGSGLTATAKFSLVEAAAR